MASSDPYEGPREIRECLRRTGNAAIALGLAILAATFLSGCGSTTSSSAGQRLAVARVSNTLSAPGAQVRIVLPAPASVHRNTFTARVRIDGFHLMQTRIGFAPRHNLGHLHFILDQGIYDQPRYSGANGQLATERGVNGYYSLAYRPLITYRGIPRGPHTLQVELVNTNDTLTGVQASVRFTVR